MSSKRHSREEALEQAFRAHREAGYITHEAAGLLITATAGIAEAEAYAEKVLRLGTLTESDERALRLLIETSSAE